MKVVCNGDDGQGVRHRRRDQTLTGLVSYSENRAFLTYKLFAILGETTRSLCALVQGAGGFHICQQ